MIVAWQRARPNRQQVYFAHADLGATHLLSPRHGLTPLPMPLPLPLCLISASLIQIHFVVGCIAVFTDNYVVEIRSLEEVLLGAYKRLDEAVDGEALHDLRI